MIDTALNLDIHQIKRQSDMTEGAIIFGVGLSVGIVIGFCIGAVARGAYQEPEEKTSHLKRYERMPPPSKPAPPSRN